MLQASCLFNTYINGEMYQIGTSGSSANCYYFFFAHLNNVNNLDLHHLKWIL